MKKKPSTKSSGVFMLSFPVASVVSQQKICTAVGIAIIMLIAVKKAFPSSGTEVANMWWTQRPNEKNDVAMSDSTIAGCPKTGRRAKVSMIEDMKPSAGMKMKYTSGWPKNQKRCCHRSASPPSDGLKKWKPNVRSKSSMVLAVITAGIAK